MDVRGQICYVLARLRIHSPDCEHCNARATCGSELLKRLEELNWRTVETDESLRIQSGSGDETFRVTQY